MKRKTLTLALAAVASAATMAFSAAPASAATSCSIPAKRLGPFGTLAGGCTISYKCTSPTPGYGGCIVGSLVDAYTYYAGSTGNATVRLITAIDGASAPGDNSCTTPSYSECHSLLGYVVKIGKTIRGACVANGGQKTIFLARCSFTRPIG